MLIDSALMRDPTTVTSDSAVAAYGCAGHPVTAATGVDGCRTSTIQIAETCAFPVLDLWADLNSVGMPSTLR